MFKRSLLLGLILISQNVLSQEKEVIEQNIKSKKIFTNENELKDWLVRCDNDTIKLFTILNNCRIDSIPEEDLYNSVYLLKVLSAKQSSVNVKKSAVFIFLKTCKSKYSNVSLLSLKTLNNLPKHCYDNASIDSISSLIVNYPVLYNDAVLLAGYVGNPVFIEKINRIFPNTRNFSKQDRWATYKALARLGDKDALDYCINKISSIPFNDQVIDVLYPDLIYIGKKEAFSIMIKALFSDEPFCSSTNPNSNERIVCGYRIIELLAPHIDKFPLKVLPSGDLDAKDYKKALLKARKWFRKVGDSYTILNS